jgi:hypothetical protein
VPGATRARDAQPTDAQLDDVEADDAAAHVLLGNFHADGLVTLLAIRSFERRASLLDLVDGPLRAEKRLDRVLDVDRFEHRVAVDAVLEHVDAASVGRSGFCVGRLDTGIGCACLRARIRGRLLGLQRGRARSETNDHQRAQSTLQPAVHSRPHPVRNQSPQPPEPLPDKGLDRGEF